MKYRKLFPTVIAEGGLSGAAALNRSLLAEMKSLAGKDRVGKDWSKKNYVGGYTSYASLSDLQYRSPVFARFADLMEPHARAFAKAQGWDLGGARLRMTSLWMNFMPKHTAHNLHLHPHSVISGAYYVSTPPGSVSLKLEDPRMGLYMNAPTRTSEPLSWEVKARAGNFVLFESWLRHEVPPNQSSASRVSLSFNYDLEAAD